jgi:phosphoribosylformylglycinamidine cyclo-ligase
MTYAKAGVDLAAGDELVDLIERHMRRTFDKRVQGKFGSFAGAFLLDYPDAIFHRGYKRPLLVACTDGVGTKVKLAAQMREYGTVGQDLVAMSINDLITQGAHPLFFLDYLAFHKLNPRVGAAIVKGIADACKGICALLGGETAEMPDVYAPGDFDMAGFAVGVVEEDRLIDGSRVRAGDLVIGLGSSGVHSNGYSLVRSIVNSAGLELDRRYPGLPKERTLGQVLLEPTRVYAKSVMAVLKHYHTKRVVNGMAHITGSGLGGNLPRAFGDRLDMVLHRASWTIPPVFGFLQEHGGVSDAEMWSVFNMGIGFALIVRPKSAKPIITVLRRQRETAAVIGEIIPGSGRVIFD